MKHLFFAAVALLIFSGCTYKNEPLSLESYKAEYKGPLTRDKKVVYLKPVKDLRAKKNIIGYVDQKSSTTINFYSNENFAEKYTEGLGYALNLAGFNTDASSSEANLVVEVSIKDIELIYNDKNFDANLNGEIEIEVVVRKGRRCHHPKLPPKRKQMDRTFV